jgi:hypothetical protein
MTYLLPAGDPVLLLPAWASPAPVDRIQPAEALTPGEEAILLTALYHHDAAQEPGFRCADDTLAGWLPVHQASRTWADNLFMYGYLRKHPNKRRKMWYGLTDDGLYRARLLADAEAAADPPLHPDCTQSASSTQQRLERQRRDNLHRLTVELSMQGFAPYAEAGRGPGHIEQAYYNVFTREVRLYRCPLGTSRWRERDGGYYAADTVPAMSEADMLAIPF